MGGSNTSVWNQPRSITRRKSTVSRASSSQPKDDADLEFLIAESGVDWSRARAVVEEFLGLYAVDVLERYRDETVWRRSRNTD